MTQGLAWRIEGLMKEWTSSLLFVLIALVLLQWLWRLWWLQLIAFFYPMLG